MSSTVELQVLPGITAATHSAKPVAGYLCSWSASGHHDNLGVETNLREEHFISRVYALLPR